MTMSEPFIRRPVATVLLTLGVALAGIMAFFKLPVSPLPQVDFPTIIVQAQLPGASPEVVSTSVATPLERHLTQIADVSEMTSTSTVGSVRIVLQFGLDRDIDGAARDVQAAINAARADLPVSLRSNPTYRKVNPADAPILVLALTSATSTPGQLYDAATTIIEQKLSQLSGVGQVQVGGGSLPAVRAELNPLALFRYGIGLEDVRAALNAANAHSPKGAIEQGARRYQIYANDQAREAEQYRDLIIAYRNGSPVRLSDVAQVQDSVENIRNAGLANGRRAVLVIIYRQPGANIIDTVDGVIEELPLLKAEIPSDIDINVAVDRSTTIRASLHDVQITLLISIVLVIMVVFLFLRSARATFVPSVAVPVSLLGTFGIMYLLGYSIDNLSLMALTIATGFVVDDAIVVLENVSRHIEAGMPRFQAALLGAREVGFTVLSMSASLVAVFIPILLMGGLIGRIFREFAMVLSIAIVVSLVVSLTTTPMMCARMLRSPGQERQGWLARGLERAFEAMRTRYDRTLRVALAHPFTVLLILVVTLGLNVYLYVIIPKGFFPQQDTGRIIGGVQADQSISFQLMRRKMTQFMSIIQKDPAVESVVGFTGGGQTNSGFFFMSLKPDHRLTADQVIARLRRELAVVPGATLFLQSVQDVRVGGRASNAQYQFTLQSDDLPLLRQWAPKITQALQGLPELRDVNSDQQDKGLETELVIDRPTAARLGLTASQIDNTLYDAFGQRQVSTIYNPLNQYHVVMEVAPQFWGSPETLKDLYVSTSGGNPSGTQSTNALAGTTGATSSSAKVSSHVAGAPSISANAVSNQRQNALGATGHNNTSASAGAAVSTSAETMVPLSAFSHYEPGTTPLGVNHQGMFVASTISFNLPPGESLSQAVTAIDSAMIRIGVPNSIHGTFQGTARVFQESLANEPVLVVTALIAVYIVLGILYESFVHPITILSTLPSAGVGAFLALMIVNTEFSLMAVIGVILLIGIVKKNAIMMIDFALDAERSRNLSSREAIYQACLLRFRPILMTTMAAILGALPLMVGTGTGSELRQPLGIAIIGGLIFSQLLTLFTTPVIYLYFDRLATRMTGRRPATPLAPQEPAE